MIAVNPGSPETVERSSVMSTRKSRAAPGQPPLGDPLGRHPKPANDRHLKTGQ
jgi:hypothetical protein